jgi:hypothetical protein
LWRRVHYLERPGLGLWVPLARCRKHGQGGRRSEPGPYRLADTIFELTGGPHCPRQMGEAARARVQDSTRDRVVERMILSLREGDSAKRAVLLPSGLCRRMSRVRATRVSIRAPALGSHSRRLRSGVVPPTPGIRRTTWAHDQQPPPRLYRHPLVQPGAVPGSDSWVPGRADSTSSPPGGVSSSLPILCLTGSETVQSV